MLRSNGRSDGEAEELELEVPWGVMAAKCWNSREGSPVLVVHGLCENAGAFDRVVRLLSKEFFYVVVDLAGHGRSSAFPRGLPLDFMNYVTQLHRIVTHFRWKKLSLMGHSFGAHLLQFYAATYPQKVNKLILLDAIAPTPVDPDMFLLFHLNRTQELLDLETSNKRPTVLTYDQALSRLLTHRMSALSPQAAKPLLQRALRTAPGGYVFTTDPRIRTEIRPPVPEDLILDLLRRISCPVLLLLADNSEYHTLFTSLPYYATALHLLRQTHPLSSLLRVSGNHCVHNNRPDLIAPHINTFLLQQKSNF